MRPSRTDQLVTLLQGLYDDADAFRWLATPQALLDHATPLQWIEQGRTEALVTLLQSLNDGVHP
jgi:hypothetical protein